MRLSSLCTLWLALVVGCGGGGEVDGGVLRDAAEVVDAPRSDAASTDTTPPTLTMLSPAGGSVNPSPAAIVAVFSEPVVSLSPALFVLSGTCTTLPTRGGVTMSASDTTATLTLSGATCTEGQTLIVSLDPTTVADVAGNPGAGSVVTNTYTLSTVGPSVALGAPSTTLLSAEGTATIAMTITPSASGGTALSGSLTETGGGITLTTLTGSPSCTAGATFISTLGAAITLSGCSGNGTLSVHVDAGVAVDALGNPSTVSPESAIITIDNAGPRVTSLSPTSGLVNPTPTTVVAVFDESMAAISASRFALSGTCTTMPTKGAVVMGDDGTTATLTLEGGDCGDGEQVTVALDPTGVTDVAGNAGSGAVLSRTYERSTAGPSASLGAPSLTRLNASATSTIALTISPSLSGDTALSGTLTPGGGGISITTLAGAPSCTVEVTSISSSGATITLSDCQGNGTFTVHADAGIAVDALGNSSTVSSESAAIVIDNAAPALTTLSPASSYVNPAPSAVVAVFDEAVAALSESHFTLGGTCTELPTKAGVVMSAGDTIATLSLVGGTCTHNQTLTVTVDPSAVFDEIGNAGTASVVTNTYTLTTVGPSASLDEPSSTVMSSAGTSTIALTFGASTAGGTMLSGTLTEVGGGVTVTTLTGNPSCTLAVSSLSPSGATITLSACSGSGTLVVQANAGVAIDALGNASSASGQSAIITIDNTGPTVVEVTPATGAVNPAPASVALSFSEPVRALSAGDFVVGGTCTTPPTKGSVTMSEGSTVATLSLSGSECTHGQTVTVSLNPASVSDLLGNAGTGSTATATYTVTTIGPRATLGTPSRTTVDSTQSATIALTLTPTLAGGTTLTDTLTAAGGGVTFTRTRGTISCTVSVNSISTAGASVVVSGCTGNGTFTVSVDAGVATDALGNASTASAESAAINVRNSCRVTGGYDFGDTVASAIRAADVNDDGLEDLIIATPTKVSVLPACASYTFGTAVSYAIGAGSGHVAVGDLSGDGKPDIAVLGAASSAASASVLLNDGTGAFGTPTVYALPGSNAVAVQIGDFDGDGDRDVAGLSSSATDSSLSVLLNPGTGSLDAAVSTTVPRATADTYTPNLFNCAALAVAPGTDDGDAFDYLVTSCPSFALNDDVDSPIVDGSVKVLRVASDGTLTQTSIRTVSSGSFPVWGSSVAFAPGTATSIVVGNPAAAVVMSFPISPAGVLGTSSNSPTSTTVFAYHLVTRRNLVLWHNGGTAAVTKGLRHAVRDEFDGSTRNLGGVTVAALQTCALVEDGASSTALVCVQGATPKVRVYGMTYNALLAWSLVLTA